MERDVALSPDVTTVGLYGYPVLMKAGLGNMLVPWAKCVVWCRDNNARMIAPFWTKLRIGPFVRFESDKRQYQFFFHHGDQVAGLERLGLLATHRKVEVANWQKSSQHQRSSVIVQFRNMDDTAMLAGRHAEVTTALYRITRPRFIPPHDPARPFVAVHVRMGDFRAAATRELRAGVHCIRIPVAWYVDALVELRRQIGWNIEARIFCDGPDDELQPLLTLQNVTRMRTQAAITDMLAISQARIVIASGSAFSMWGSYLGHAPTLWHPGQNFTMRPRTANQAFDAEWDRDLSMPTPFLDAVRDRLDRQAVCASVAHER